MVRQVYGRYFRKSGLLFDLGNQFCLDQKPRTSRFYHQFCSRLRPQIIKMFRDVASYTGFLPLSFFSFYIAT